MDIRRTLLWAVFAFSLILLWNNWQTHNGQPSLLSPATGSRPVTAETAQSASTSPADVPTASPPVAASASAPGLPALAMDNAAASSGQFVSISTDVYELVFDTQGAQLIQARLLRYADSRDDSRAITLLNNAAHDFYVAQTGLVSAQVQNLPTHLTPFRLVSSQTEMSGQTLDVVFEAEANQVRVVKTFTLHRGRYDINVRHQVLNLTEAPLQASVYLQLTRDGNDPAGSSFFYHTFTGPSVYSSAEKFQKVSFSDVDKKKNNYVRDALDGWIGMVQHYFASAWVPEQGRARHNEVLRVGENRYAVRSVQALETIAPGREGVHQARLWVGPQDQQAMQQVAPGLDVVVDYGFLAIIAKPLFALMTWIHGLAGNWGWTIVLLTLLIKLVFYPLSAASYRSMARMKHVGPRMQAMREKYGDDRAKLNAAMMEMYRTEKINPLGGCLPMLVQIPVFISLYWVLIGSVEMRGAPWILWINDLAATDPWFILPAIMMGTMFLQIKLNPTPPDPMQAKVMMIMPLVFGGMMFFFPAGLVLYWCVNNIVSIAQQRLIMHRLEKAAAAAKR